MTDRQRQPEWPGQSAERVRSRIRDRFGLVFLLLITTVFFSISAPNERWAWLATTVLLAAGVMLALAASGARPVVVRIGLAIATIDLGATITIDLAQVGGDSRKYLSTASLLLTLLAIGAIARRISIHREISTLTVLGAVCLYVLLGLSFAFAFESVGEFGPQPFFTPPGAGTRSDYVYFSFTTLATVGYGDLTAQDGVGRALAVTEGVFGQIYLVTTVAALVGNLGRTSAPLHETKVEPSEEDETGSG